MHLASILEPERTAYGLKVASKKRVLQLLGKLLAQGQPGLDESEVFETLVARERLGSTAIGHGIAIPHGRAREGDHVVGALVCLSEGVDFDAADGQPVDLLFGLLVPEGDAEAHLQVLSQLAEMFRDLGCRDRLRAAKSDTDLYEVAVHLLSAEPDDGDPHGLSPD